MPSDPAPEPLTPDEERAWRSLIRVMVLLPRAVDEDLTRRGGPGLTRYVVLMRLSEAPGQTMRMSELADAASISPSRLTRIIQAMTAERSVLRTAAPDDGRASLVTLTDLGLRQLREAWPAHLAGVRALVLDHLKSADLAEVSRVAGLVLEAIDAASAGSSCPAGAEPPRETPPLDSCYGND